MKAAWITHPSCLLHEAGSGHPECPERLAVIEKQLIASGLHGAFARYTAPPASAAALARVHDPEHVRTITGIVADTCPRYLDPDTAMTTHTLEAALHAAGAGIFATDLVIGGNANFVFCAVRPPGHHAERARAMGFCVFNNIAVAAAHALETGASRVALIDFDVHYGNGTARMFGADPRACVCSIYQAGLYPHWSGGPQLGSLVDIPMDAGDGGARLREGVLQRWLPALDAFAPQIVYVSAGFDAHAEDPLGGLRLAVEDYRWLGEQIRDCAARHAQSRVVAMLEGGYNLDVLGPSVEAFVRPFL